MKIFIYITNIKRNYTLHTALVNKHDATTDSVDDLETKQPVAIAMPIYELNGLIMALPFSLVQYGLILKFMSLPKYR